MTRLALLLAGLTALLAQDLSGPVVRVVDGDTIEVLLAGERERIRYIGIDTPEISDPRPEVREMAYAASRANARLVAGRHVRLELDLEKRDRYGRLLAYVWIGDTLVNEALVRSGYAAPYTFPPNARYVDRFVAAAREARAGRDQLAKGRGAEPPRAAPAEGRGAPPEDDGRALAALGMAAIPAPSPEPASRSPENVSYDSDSLTPIEAAAHIGERATVCGYVASTRYLRRGRRPTFLNLGRPYPDQDLTVLIWGADRAKFAEAPERVFQHERICVTGRIETYRGTPQIVVREPKAAWVAE